MVTIETSNDELLEIMKEEQQKAVYWLERKTGDKRAWEIEKALKKKCRETGIPQTSDLVKYKARSGNIWYAYYRAFPVGGMVFVASFAFLYKNSTGSVTVYMPFDGPGGEMDRRVLIFPPHFFARMGQNLGIKVESEDMIKRFLGMVQTMVINEKGDSDKRKAEVEMVFSGAVWRGIYLNEDIRVIKVSTFIKKTALSNKQKKEAEKFEGIQKKIVRHNEYTTRRRIEQGQGAQILKELASNSFTYHAWDDELESQFVKCAVMVKKVGDYMGMKFTFDDVLKVWIDDCATSKHEIIEAFFNMAFVFGDKMEIINWELTITSITLMRLGCYRPKNEMSYCLGMALSDFRRTWMSMAESEFFRVTRKDFMV